MSIRVKFVEPCSCGVGRPGVSCLTIFEAFGGVVVGKGLRSHHGRSGEANRLLDQCGVLGCVVGKGLRSHHGKSGEANRLSDQCGVLDCVVGRDIDAFSDPFSGCTW